MRSKPQNKNVPKLGPFSDAMASVGSFRKERIPQFLVIKPTTFNGELLRLDLPFDQALEQLTARVAAVSWGGVGALNSENRKKSLW